MFMKSLAFNQSIDKWDVSKVTTMKWMFDGSQAFNQPIDKLDVSNVENMDHMFRDSSFKQELSDEWKNHAKKINSQFF